MMVSIIGFSMALGPLMLMFAVMGIISMAVSPKPLQLKTDFSPAPKYTMLVQTKPSFVYKEYTCTPMPERKMIYKSYSVEAIA